MADENIKQSEEFSKPKSYYEIFHCRFLALVFMCFLGFGSYFCYDNTSALPEQIMKDMQVDNAGFMLLNSLYSWPNVILCFIGGYLIDRYFGIRLGSIIFATIVFFGQIVFALGALFNHFWLMLLGRFIFGTGGESLAVAQNSYAVSWFKGKELNLVFGLQLSISRAGSTVNMNVMEPLYDALSKIYYGHTCLGMALMIASSTCLFSVIISLLLGFLDKKAEQSKKLLEMSSVAENKSEKIQLKDILQFPVSLWLLCGICVFYYCSIFPFISMGKLFFETKFKKSNGSASFINSLVYIISAASSPVFGFIVDRTGRNIAWVFLGILSTIANHVFIAFSFVEPTFIMVWMGLSYSILASSLWPIVAYIIPEHQLGTAYGVMQAIQNLGLATIPIFIGWMLDNHGYLLTEMIFICSLCVALLFTVILYIVDSINGGLANLSAKERSALEVSLEKKLEKDPLLAINGTEEESYRPHPLLKPLTDFDLRNRFLSRMGYQFPSHLEYHKFPMAHRGLTR